MTTWNEHRIETELVPAEIKLTQAAAKNDRNTISKLWDHQHPMHLALTVAKMHADTLKQLEQAKTAWRAEHDAHQRTLATYRHIANNVAKRANRAEARVDELRDILYQRDPKNHTKGNN